MKRKWSVLLGDVSPKKTVLENRHLLKKILDFLGVFGRTKLIRKARLTGDPQCFKTLQSLRILNLEDVKFFVRDSVIDGHIQMVQWFCSLPELKQFCEKRGGQFLSCSLFYNHLPMSDWFLDVWEAPVSQRSLLVSIQTRRSLSLFQKLLKFYFERENPKKKIIYLKPWKDHQFSDLEHCEFFRVATKNRKLLMWTDVRFREGAKGLSQLFSECE